MSNGVLVILHTAFLAVFSERKGCLKIRLGGTASFVKFRGSCAACASGAIARPSVASRTAVTLVIAARTAAEMRQSPCNDLDALRVSKRIHNPDEREGS